MEQIKKLGDENRSAFASDLQGSEEREEEQDSIRSGTPTLSSAASGQSPVRHVEGLGALGISSRKRGDSTSWLKASNTRRRAASAVELLFLFLQGREAFAGKSGP